MTATWRWREIVLLSAMAWTSLSCDPDTRTERCPSGLRCPTAWQCAADQDVCIKDDCGDGHVDPAVGEVCDDGNILDDDDCSADCSWQPGCGDGTTNSGEICDDGNQESGDGCSHDCQSDETCGNEYGDIHEACDDGNTDSGDGCSGDCQSTEYCGNEYTDVYEDCDAGAEDDWTCDADCTYPTCGDGHFNPEFSNPFSGVNEECDAGGDSADCDGDCTQVRCGDGYSNPAAGESCDDGNPVPGDGCNPDCNFG